MTMRARALAAALVAAGVCLAAWPAAAGAQPARDRYQAAQGLEATARARIARRPTAARRPPGRRRLPRRCGRSIATRRFRGASPPAATATTRCSRPPTSPARSTRAYGRVAHRELVTKYVTWLVARVPVELAAHRGQGEAAQRRGDAAGPPGWSRLTSRRRRAARARPRLQPGRRRRRGRNAAPRNAGRAAAPRRRRSPGPPGDRADRPARRRPAHAAARSRGDLHARDARQPAAGLHRPARRDRVAGAARHDAWTATTPCARCASAAARRDAGRARSRSVGQGQRLCALQPLPGGDRHRARPRRRGAACRCRPNRRCCSPTIRSCQPPPRHRPRLPRWHHRRRRRSRSGAAAADRPGERCRPPPVVPARRDRADAGT